LDDPVPPNVIEEIQDLGHIYNVRLAHLG